MSVKARMVCDWIKDHGSMKVVHLYPVYSSDKASPNHSYSQATPSGSIELTITNPGAYDQFTPGASYDITFEPTPPA